MVFILRKNETNLYREKETFAHGIVTLAREFSNISKTYNKPPHYNTQIIGISKPVYYPTKVIHIGHGSEFSTIPKVHSFFMQCKAVRK